jgi:hypothetical protein
MVAIATWCSSIRQGRTGMTQANRQHGPSKNTGAISWICVFLVGMAEWKREPAWPDNVTVEGGVLRQRPSSWDNHDGVGPKRLKLAYRRLLTTVSEIPLLFEYIDFGGPPDRLQITNIGGYPVGPDMEPGS